MRESQVQYLLVELGQLVGMPRARADPSESSDLRRGRSVAVCERPRACRRT